MKTLKPEELLKLFDASDMAIFKWKNDEGWSISYAAETVEKVFGFSDEDFLSDSITYAELIHKEDLPRVFEEVTDALTKNVDSFVHKPYRVRHKEGHYIWVDDTTVLLKNEEDVVLEFLGYIRDISEIKRSEDKLREINARYEFAIDGSNDGIWDWNILTNEVYYSPRWKEILGYSSHELMNDFSTFEKLCHAEDLILLMHNIEEQSSHEREELSIQIRMMHKDGTYRWILNQGKMQFNDSDKAVRMVGTQTDVTLEVKYQDSLQKNKKFLDSVLDSIFDGVIACNEKGEITFINKHASRMYGIDFINRFKVDTSSLQAYELDKTTRIEIDDFPIMRAIKTHEPQEKEYMIILEDRKERFIHTTAVPTFDSDGHLSGAVASLHDMTTRKKNQDELIRAKNEAEIANRSKTQFLANMSHEIRTPMNAIVGFSELLEKSDINNQQRNYLQSIRNSSKTLLTLINDILDISKIEAGKVGIEKHEVNITQILKEMYDIFLIKADEKGIELLLEIEEGVPEYLLIDEIRVRQILINLLSNALKFTHKGFVKLHCSQHKRAGEHIDLHIDVIDSGIGVEENQVDKIFDLFEQQDNQSTREYGGTGLGLSISRKLALMMNGNVYVKTEQEKGSTFSLCLRDIIFNEQQEVKSDTHNLEYIFEQANILIVDDVAMNRMLLKAFIEDYDFRTCEATNGQEALDRLEIGMPNMILMDLRMPVMDGYEATKRIRADKRFKDIPIIAVTASVVFNNNENIHIKGFDGFIEKPVSEEALLEVLSQFLPSEVFDQTSLKNELSLSQTGIDSLSSLLVVLEDDKFQEKISNVLDENNFDLYEEFAHYLQRLSDEYDNIYLRNYAKELLSLTESFDVIGLKKLLGAFETIKVKISNSVS